MVGLKAATTVASRVVCLVRKKVVQKAAKSAASMAGPMAASTDVHLAEMKAFLMVASTAGLTVVSKVAKTA